MSDLSSMFSEVQRWRDVVIYHLPRLLPELSNVADRLASREPAISADYASFARAIAKELTTSHPDIFQGEPDLFDDLPILDETHAALAAQGVITAIALCLARLRARNEEEVSSHE